MRRGETRRCSPTLSDYPPINSFEWAVDPSFSSNFSIKGVTVKSRIEIQVDVELDNYHLVNGLRQMIEDSAWDATNDFRKENPGTIKSVMVQANEAAQYDKGY